MTGLVATFLSIGVLAGFALLGGGAWLLVKGNDRKRAMLMLLAALVLFANVLTWTL